MPQIAAFIDFKHRIDIPAAIGERRAEQIIFPLPLIRKDKRVPNMNLIRCYRFYRPKSLFHRIDQLSFPLIARQSLDSTSHGFSGFRSNRIWASGHRLTAR